MWDFTGKTFETFHHILEHCVGSSLTSLHDQLIINYLMSFSFNLIVRFCKLPEFLFHAFSTICGILVLYLGLLGSDIFIHLSLILSGYIMLYFAFKLRDFRRDHLSPIYMTEVTCVFFLMLGEFYYTNAELWLRCRGIAMIAVMKLISFVADFHRNIRPGFLQYTGYLLCPANCLLGPWMKYSDYVRLNKVQPQLNLNWMLRVLKCTSMAVVYLSISNCFAEHYIPDSNDWIIAYKKALCFRTSHYFISYLAEAVMLTAGYNEKTASPEWSYIITKPAFVELPRSLATVVVYWNIPMHRFLKLYIYILYLPHGRAIAIFLTYFFSSLLHGMNVQIGLVLLSLGGFSYIQAISQRLASKYLNACVKVRPCCNCQHRFRKYHPLTMIMNLCFMVLNIAHLTYLGSVMNIISTNRSIYDTLLKWEILGFSSHHIFFVIFCTLWVFKVTSIEPDEPAPPMIDRDRAV